MVDAETCWRAGTRSAAPEITRFLVNITDIDVEIMRSQASTAHAPANHPNSASTIYGGYCATF
jgi:hypothetical protein